MKLGNSWKVFLHYRYLLGQLVSRDFKVKYKRSVLGVLWSVLNPLLTMVIMSIVFIQLFHMGGRGSGVPDYPVYLLSGLVLWNGFSEATNMAIGSIIGNFPLLTKVYIPKYIFPLSKVLSSSINMLFSFIALYFIMIVEVGRGQIPFLWQNVFMPYDFVCVLVFAIGVGLIISALTVFFRDMIYIWGVIMTAWMYLTPIMYSMELVKDSQKWYTPYFITAMKFNPMYHFVDFAHTIIFVGTPGAVQFINCAAFALIALVIGIVFFRSQQDRFILYI